MRNKEGLQTANISHTCYLFHLLPDRKVCVLPVSEAAGSQVRKLTVLQSTFNQLIQSVMKERLMLSIHIFYTLDTNINTHTV